MEYANVFQSCEILNVSYWNDIEWIFVRAAQKYCAQQLNKWRFEAEECGKAGELLGDKMHYLKFYERDFSQD